MHAGDAERGREQDAQPAIDAELGAVGTEPAHSGEHAAAHRDDGQRHERPAQRGHHPDVAVEQRVGKRPGRRGQRDEHRKRG